MLNEFSDINSVMTMNTNNIFGDKKFKSVQNLINQRFSARQTKDLFSQKLFSGYILGDIPNNILAEDEKVKDEEEEEEEEEKEKTENDTTKNELNDLIEEKKSETENNIDNNAGEDKKKEDFKEIE